MRPYPLFIVATCPPRRACPMPGPIPAAQARSSGPIALRSRGHCVITALPNRVRPQERRPTSDGTVPRALRAGDSRRGDDNGERARQGSPEAGAAFVLWCALRQRGRAGASQSCRLCARWACELRHARACSGQDDAGGGMQGVGHARCWACRRRGMQGTEMAMTRWPRARRGDRLPLLFPRGPGHRPKPRAFGLPPGWVGAGAGTSAP